MTPSENLHTLDPELRRSLTKLCCTINIDDTAEDLDVINPKLLGRDELEVLRMKKMKIKSREEEEEEEQDEQENEEEDSEIKK